jgi:hypothetical protein
MSMTTSFGRGRKDFDVVDGGGVMEVRSAFDVYRVTRLKGDVVDDVAGGVIAVGARRG